MGKLNINSKLTAKQRLFCDEYLISMNATNSYKKAGYHFKNDNVAGVEAYKLIRNPKVKAYIGDMMQKHEDSLIMSAVEVLKALTASARGETTEDVVIVEGIGDGCSKAKTVTKTISEKDRLKALELLGKRHSLFTERVDLNANMVVFQGEDKLED